MVLAFAGCGASDGARSSDDGVRGPLQINEAIYTSRDPQQIAQHRADLRERVRESCNEPKMLAEVGERCDIEGYEPTAAYDVRTLGHYDQATGRWSWQAFECRNPSCNESGARPFLFPHVIKGANFGDDGKPVWPKNAIMEPVCPKCGRKDKVAGYTLPETVARQAELEQELSASRNARQQGAATTGEHRTPQEIMDEMAALPKVYLVAE